jgi:transposase
MSNKSKRKRWAKHVARWRASGVSSEAYGAKLGVTGRCVRRWDKALRDERRRRRPRAPQLVRVEVAPAAAPEQPVVVSVGLRRIEVLGGFSKATLAAVLEVVERRS